MHDFDIDRAHRFEGDMKFKIGGEVFAHRPAVRPEVQQAWEEIDKNTTGAEALEITDNLIVAWLDTDQDPTAETRWRELRARETDPISQRDLTSLIVWLYSQSTRRPTEPLSSSEGGRGATGTSLTATSSTERAEASAA